MDGMYTQPYGISSQSTNTTVDGFEALENYFTGNTDYARQLEMMASEQAYNSLEARKERDWSKMMSDTSYQRAVADLRAAGLNPALAYSAGGASVGQGVAASIGAHAAGRSGRGFGDVFKLISTLLTMGAGIGASASATAMRTASAEQVANIKATSARDVAKITAASYNYRTDKFTEKPDRDHIKGFR